MCVSCYMLIFSVAVLLVTVPFSFDTTTLYDPVFVYCTLLITNDVLVSPVIVAPSNCH